MSVNRKISPQRHKVHKEKIKSISIILRIGPPNRSSNYPLCVLRTFVVNLFCKLFLFILASKAWYFLC